MLHTAARLRFVEENGLAHSDFDFARYLACRLGHALGELVEVPALTQRLVLKFSELQGRVDAVDGAVRESTRLVSRRRRRAQAQTWILLEVVLLCFWQADVRLGPNSRLFLWLLTGYATCVSTYVLHAKLRLILHDYCAPFVEADVEMMHRLGAAAERDLGGHERFPTSPRTPPSTDAA